MLLHAVGQQWWTLHNHMSVCHLSARLNCSSTQNVSRAENASNAAGFDYKVALNLRPEFQGCGLQPVDVRVQHFV